MLVTAIQSVLHYVDKNCQTCATLRLPELYNNHVIKRHYVSRLQVFEVALPQLHPAASPCIVGGSIVNQSLVFLFDPSERDQRRD